MTDTAAGRVQAVVADYIAAGRLAAPRYDEADIVALLDEHEQLRNRAVDAENYAEAQTIRLDARTEERDALAARFAELEAHPWIEVVWLTADKEGNYGVWNDPDHAREQLASGYTAASPGTYEWVTDADWTHELLLRDGEPTGLRLWMAHVADAARAETGSGEPQTTHDTETDHA